jgi:hypothetical protein
MISFRFALRRGIWADWELNHFQIGRLDQVGPEFAQLSSNVVRLPALRRPPTSEYAQKVQTSWLAH